MDTNTNLLKSIQTMVVEQVNSAPYDKTRNAVILENLGGGYYRIRLDGVDYPRVKSYGLVDNLTKNTTVKVVIPGNISSQMYITTAGGNIDLSAYATKAYVDAADATLQTNINGKVAKGDSNIDTMNKSVLLDFFYPVGTIYETSDSSFNPETQWGGTWTKVEGRVLVGAGTSDATYNIGTLETPTQGGESTHLLTGAEAAQKAVSIGSSGAHTHTLKIKTASPSNTGSYSTDQVQFGKPTGATYTNANPFSWTSSGDHTHSISASNATTAHNNMPPYEVVNIWKRIA